MTLDGSASSDRMPADNDGNETGVASSSQAATWVYFAIEDTAVPQPESNEIVLGVAATLITGLAAIVTEETQPE
jgi:hypothetical protein